MSRFLLQMAGIPGGGKTTIAREVSRRTKAIALDKDVIMASAVRNGVQVERAGGLAYEMGFTLARSLLKEGQSVVLDSPANFTMIRKRGREVAAEAGVQYFMVECTVPDQALAEARISRRKPLHALHPTTLEGVDLTFAREGTAPLSESRLAIDTSQPLSECVAKVLEYLRS